MWEPQRLTSLWASTASYRDSFTSYLCQGMWEFLSSRCWRVLYGPQLSLVLKVTEFVSATQRYIIFVFWVRYSRNTKCRWPVGLLTSKTPFDCRIKWWYGILQSYLRYLPNLNFDEMRPTSELLKRCLIALELFPLLIVRVVLPVSRRFS
jgi:hypothetical protein